MSFSDGLLQNRAELNQRISEIFIGNQKCLCVLCNHASLGGQFSDLIALMHAKTSQRAAVLIDEYDKPIVNNMTNVAVAMQMREGLKIL